MRGGPWRLRRSLGQVLLVGSATTAFALDALGAPEDWLLGASYAVGGLALCVGSLFVFKDPSRWADRRVALNLAAWWVLVGVVFGLISVWWPPTATTGPTPVYEGRLVAPEGFSLEQAEAFAGPFSDGLVDAGWAAVDRRRIAEAVQRGVDLAATACGLLAVSDQGDTATDDVARILALEPESADQVRSAVEAAGVVPDRAEPLVEGFFVGVYDGARGLCPEHADTLRAVARRRT